MRTTLPHLRALDGLRGLAVAAVLAFHGGVAALQGGFLGVDAFFVLSGFLITALLLTEQAGTGRIALGAFWVLELRHAMFVASTAWVPWILWGIERYAANGKVSGGTT